MPIQWIWSGLCSFGHTELVWGHWRRLHCRGCTCFCRLGEVVGGKGVGNHWKVLSREAIGSKWCIRKMILALRLPLKKNHCQKRLSSGGAVSTWCQDETAKQASWPCCAAMGPLSLSYMATGSATQAWASLICRLSPLLFLGVSSLPFHLSQYQFCFHPTLTEYWYHLHFMMSHNPPEVFSSAWLTPIVLYSYFPQSIFD